MASSSTKQTTELTESAAAISADPKTPQDLPEDKEAETVSKTDTAQGTSAEAQESVTTADSDPAEKADQQQQAKAEPVSAEDASEKAAAAIGPTEDAEDTKGTKDNPDTANPQAKKPAPDIDIPTELDKLSKELPEIGPKSTSKLVTVDNLLNRFRKLIAAENTELLEKAAAIREALDKKFADNAKHQVTLKESTTALLEKLAPALEEGQSLDALPTWDKIQANINNTNGDIRQHLQALANPFKPKIIELRDWKVFAATEKKKELIAQMEKLAESKMNPGDKSKHITRLHKEWKELGRSNQNEELWQQFKQFSDRAYEPCTEYFKQRKQQMAENLKARRELCDQLEATIQAQAENTPRIADFNKLIKDSEESWKKHAPVEQSKIRSLQKRFYACINKLRKQRKSILRANAAQKRTLIEQATALTELEDRSQAMQEAKRLQQEWKKVGPTSFKEDKEYWDKFRGACDKIFESRDSAKPSRSSKNQDVEKSLQTKFDGLKKILELPDEDLRNARNDYQDLTQGFASALDALDKRQRSKQLEKFNSIKRKIDNRIRALPDKKSLALLETLSKAADYLQQIESEAQAATADKFAEVKNKFSVEDWQAIDKGPSKNLIEYLEQRVTALQKSSALAEFQTFCDKTIESARRLCIETEIRSGTESPETDQALRMELQLSQLQKGLGQARHTTKENMKFAQEARLQLMCMGPLPTTAREEYQKRLEESSKRLF